MKKASTSSADQTQIEEVNEPASLPAVVDETATPAKASDIVR
jgi:hypothetical protein